MVAVCVANFTVHCSARPCVECDLLVFSCKPDFTLSFNLIISTYHDTFSHMSVYNAPLPMPQAIACNVCRLTLSFVSFSLFFCLSPSISLPLFSSFCLPFCCTKGLVFLCVYIWDMLVVLSSIFVFLALLECVVVQC